MRYYIANGVGVWQAMHWSWLNVFFRHFVPYVGPIVSVGPHLFRAYRWWRDNPSPKRRFAKIHSCLAVYRMQKRSPLFDWRDLRQTRREHRSLLRAARKEGVKVPAELRGCFLRGLIAVTRGRRAE